MQEGLIFDIQRGAMHDGPGIRTAVFFQGCPLRCVWCHNPESHPCKGALSYRADRCQGCRACEAACVQRVHSFPEGVHRIDRAACISCGKCAAACPAGALRFPARRRSVREVLDLALRDLRYYEASGGGLTLTGGEPMLQPEFALALLSAAKAEGIHTCVETCGLASAREFERLLPFADLFLFDLKAADPDRHRRFTGAGNAQILANLELLARRGAAVHLRCPLIPGLNDTEEDLAGIARLAKRLPDLRAVEILPYHNAGNGKYHEYGIENLLPGRSAACDAERDAWMEAFRGLGLELVSPA